MDDGMKWWSGPKVVKSIYFEVNNPGSFIERKRQVCLQKMIIQTSTSITGLVFQGGQWQAELWSLMNQMCCQGSAYQGGGEKKRQANICQLVTAMTLLTMV